MTFRKYKFYRLFRSIFYAGYDPEYAAMIAYWIKNKKLISENYMNRVLMMPMKKNEIILFSSDQLKYLDEILLKLKKQIYKADVAGE